MARDRCLFIVLFTMPTLVVLSMWIGVGSCECPSLWGVNHSILALRVLRNSAPSSDSAADAATSLRMAQVMCMLPLRLMGLFAFGRLPLKKYPPTRLHGLPADRYDASECTVSIISDERNPMTALG